MLLKKTAILVGLCLLFEQALTCSPRQAEHGYICVCNATYCDTVPPLGDITDQNLRIYFTADTYPGWNVNDAQFSNNPDPAAYTIQVNEYSYQTIIGFGGAFTDAASMNIKKLSPEAQEKLLEAYFGDDGIEYNICRVPLGACDFSVRPYTYDDVDNDRDLEYFSLQSEDLDFKIPVIKQAQALRGDKQLFLFGSSWTAPLWMKDFYAWYGGPQLARENFELFANYTIRTFDDYLAQGVQFWGLTTANEPLTGYYISTQIPSMGWSITDQVRWLVDYLGPALKNSQHRDLKIMIHDDNAITLPFVIPVFFENDRALELIDGIATHWYWDGNMGDIVYDISRTDKKDLFYLSSESCHFGMIPPLGSWDMVRDYLWNIYKDLNMGYAGWVEWNLALNITGGPTHIDVPADAPIIISEDYSEFYKQPTFYILGHFSKFVIPGSVRLDITIPDGRVQTLAFLRPDNLKVVMVYNYNPFDIPVQVLDNGRTSDSINTPANSLSTIVYRA